MKTIIITALILAFASVGGADEIVYFDDGTCSKIYCDETDSSRCGGITVPCPPGFGPTPKTCWEYKELLHGTEHAKGKYTEVTMKDLHVLGQEGWELATIKQHPFDDFVSSYIFKRPKKCGDER